MKNNFWKLLTICLFILILNFNTVHAATNNFTSLKEQQSLTTNFDISIAVKSPNSAHVTENWTVDISNQRDLDIFKEKILKANINIDKLSEIDSNLKPHIYINDFSDVTVSFDEVNNIVILEYIIDDLTLIEYLDYDDKIIWKLNENLFRNFITNNLYSIPKDSYIKIKLYNPLVFGDPVPKTTIENDQLIWTGVSSNELRLLAIEKKPPKPSFVLGDLIKNNYLNQGFLYIVFILVILTIVLLIFKDKVNNKIKSFVINNSVIKTKKRKRDIVDFEYSER